MLKILTLNLNYYGDKHGPWKERKKLIAEAIREKDPDVVAFQACCSDPEIENGVNQAVQLANVVDYKFRHFFAASRQTNGRQEGNAIISKIAPNETSQFLLTLNAGAEDPVQRLVAKAVYNLNSGPITLYNAHFSWVGNQTRENVSETVRLLKQTPGKFLLAGDLNTDPKDNLLQPFKETGLFDVWEINKGKEDGYTFESDKPFTRIDYAWANGDLAEKARNVEIVKKESSARMSDHLGLLVSLDL